MSDNGIRGFTLHEPHASLLACRAKIFETRSWAKPDHIDLIAIHAGKKIQWECFEGPMRRHYFEALRIDPTSTREQIAARMNCGRIVCVCRAGPSQLSTGRVPQIGLNDKRWNSTYQIFGDFSPGRFAWPLEVALKCEPPIVCKGAQGLWRLPVEIERVLLKEIR